MRYDESLWLVLKEIDDVNDIRFELVCGLLSYCLRHNGLSPKQCNLAKKVFKQYAYLFPDANKDDFKLEFSREEK